MTIPSVHIALRHTVFTDPQRSLPKSRTTCASRQSASPPLAYHVGAHAVYAYEISPPLPTSSHISYCDAAEVLTKQQPWSGCSPWVNIDLAVEHQGSDVARDRESERRP